ncbi:hypothetical protein N425_13680 [Tannerella sp. oral taxon BU063 isolate Cell 2]|uniref:Uncharacterized protein n=1 Tax=Tannerella sp. oral taxon BU063 isolate Cell 2 TaxID=1411148 RepID=W2C2Q4_9BACT|nr:hypothetical protein N425_13680 [Tannerella sp. oral taxon BU063 isolate Cell 2]
MEIKFLIGIGRGVLHTSQNPPGLRFIVQSGIEFLIGIGRGVLHTSQNLPGLSVIRLHAEAFMGRMQYAPT